LDATIQQGEGILQLAWDEIQANAVTFSKKWQNAKNEEAE